MTRHDESGDPLSGADLAREVLTPDELADYHAARRRIPRRQKRRPQRDRHDELGYRGGIWDPYYDPGEVR